MRVEPTRPEPPVTNTFISDLLLRYRRYSLRGPGDQHRLRGRRLGQHAPEMCRTVVKDLVPQLEREQPPNFAREAAGALEIRKYGIGIHKWAVPGVATAKGVLDEVAQFTPKPFLQRHREPHFVAAVGASCRPPVGIMVPLETRGPTTL